ncbi:ATP-dependent zinc metalloprotease FtsH, partial [Dissostichus eleginoides]
GWGRQTGSRRGFGRAAPLWLWREHTAALTLRPRLHCCPPPPWPQHSQSATREQRSKVSNQ